PLLAGAAAGWPRLAQAQQPAMRSCDIDSPSRLSSVHSHVAVGPVSRPIRTAPGAFDLTNVAIASGSESTTPSRTTDGQLGLAASELAALGLSPSRSPNLRSR